DIKKHQRKREEDTPEFGMQLHSTATQQAVLPDNISTIACRNCCQVISLSTLFMASVNFSSSKSCFMWRIRLTGMETAVAKRNNGSINRQENHGDFHAFLTGLPVFD